MSEAERLASQAEQPEALRLAEWAEWFCRNVNDPKDFRWVHMAESAAELRRLSAELASLKAAMGEPVAWIRPSGKAMLESGGYCTVYASDGMSNHSTPLYTHPAQQAKPKPITEQELKAGREAVTDDPDEQPDPWSFRMGAWFAERHHGIKE